MFRKLLTLFCAACVLALSGITRAGTENAKELVMFVGEITTIPASRIQRIAIGNGALISTRFIDDTQMLLIAEGVEVEERVPG